MKYKVTFAGKTKEGIPGIKSGEWHVTTQWFDHAHEVDSFISSFPAFNLCLIYSVYSWKICTE